MPSTRCTPLALTPEELVRAVGGDLPWFPTDPAVVLVPADDHWPAPDPQLALTSAVVVGMTKRRGVDPRDTRGAAWCDVVLAHGDPQLDVIVERVGGNPLAAAAVAQVLRGAESRAIDDGLLLESAVYSALQSGPEFRAWRAARPRKTRPEPAAPVVLLAREESQLTITLNRPHVRNALDTRMRNALVDAFRLVASDDSLETVVLTGAGPDYSSGGDLDEFGSFSDPASAHVVRLAASAGRELARVADRVRADLHGACMGSGIELPAFASTVVAAANARFALPELQLGLIPGAGGTWSLPQRIGRHRTALLALTCSAIDAATALDWGLVDRVAP